MRSRRRWYGAPSRRSAGSRSRRASRLGGFVGRTLGPRLPVSRRSPRQPPPRLPRQGRDRDRGHRARHVGQPGPRCRRVSPPRKDRLLRRGRARRGGGGRNPRPTQQRWCRLHILRRPHCQLGDRTTRRGTTRLGAELHLPPRQQSRRRAHRRRGARTGGRGPRAEGPPRRAPGQRRASRRRPPRNPRRSEVQRGHRGTLLPAATP